MATQPIGETDPAIEDAEDEEEEGEQAEGWDDWGSDEDSAPEYLCLFCPLRFDSAGLLFGHCCSEHRFDFHGIVRDLGLDFYGSLKLVNYVRSQVSQNKCWSCGLSFQCSKDVQDHLHLAVGYKDGKLPWEDDMYLKPSMSDDALLHSLSIDEDEEEYTASVSKEELMRELMSNEDLTEIFNDNRGTLDSDNSKFDFLQQIGKKETCIDDMSNHFDKIMINGTTVGGKIDTAHLKMKDKQLSVSFTDIAAKEVKNVNENYFGAYSSFGIHWEMISDKIRTDAYRDAILKNPSLMNQATVMDVGCGTGILSLFAAQAGASRVFAVEASAKMATVATQIVRDNGLLSEGDQNLEVSQKSGIIDVVQSMVEEVDKFMHIPPHSVDVLVSEWMGYCLLYESMLSSVLFARDRWLKPGGAILPDTATIFIAGFGKGGTSIPFWENVYGFNMSCIGREVVGDAARFPIVDVLDSEDIVTESVVLQSFDLAAMKTNDMDFTATSELLLKSNLPRSSTSPESRTCWCYGIVLWFETGFTSRFCKEMPTVLSTSPYRPRTHWSQTIFTFQVPIAMQSATSLPNPAGTAIGSEECPAVRLRSRISIARSSMHRSIDISMEITGISSDGRKRNWPAQVFNL